MMAKWQVLHQCSKRPQVQPRKLQVSQPHFGHWQNQEVSPLRTGFWAREGEGGYLEQSAWIDQR